MGFVWCLVESGVGEFLGLWHMMGKFVGMFVVCCNACSYRVFVFEFTLFFGAMLRVCLKGMGSLNLLSPVVGLNSAYQWICIVLVLLMSDDDGFVGGIMVVVVVFVLS